MSRQHNRASGRNRIDVVDKDNALSDEAINNRLVVHDLVKAIHRCGKRANHPRKSLDGHLDTSTEASRGSKQHSIYLRCIRHGHGLTLVLIVLA